MVHSIMGNLYPPFAEDEAQTLQTWNRLLESGCPCFYPSHGKPVSREKLESHIRENGAGSREGSTPGG